MAFFERVPRATDAADAATTAATSLLPDPEGPGRVLAAVDRIEGARWADPLIKPLRGVVRRLPPPTRDVLHGRWLGHPVHPALVQVPLGTWTSAALLDLIPGKGRGAGALIAVGLVSAAPAAVAGLADWADLRKPQARVGLVHAAANSAAIACYAASLVARLRGRRLRGRALGFAGLTSATVGGALGGHLAYRQAAGANHAEQVAAVVEPGWHLLGSLSEFPVGTPVVRVVSGVPVMVLREPDDVVRVIADRCSHMAGPLSEGEIADGCVTCPWHGSVFRLSDGWNIRGPATAPQPVFETRVTTGRVMARLPGETKEL
ncbi:Rieske 2Fe-2S domain-containing protein [Streptomyces radicis]|uniref:Rieske (2Fe-2S) protein n=1 Tax=Streptomyces radicis TaxID=1750517 RepID=A0A3A9WBK3_9ACTN|nr:Rieske (2Fe-2S) protein [Streptomyces radicis]RKN10478.1 Rieske (2Fe-2S) protein [Streptomyces radicis]RKN24737.1 Rieske (2Fe-2S) protein [Streptomyces radicis]